MIPNYRLPQVTIEQAFADEGSNTLDRNRAVVVGPAYQHADAGSDNLVWSTYSEGGTLTYTSRKSDGSTAVKPAGHVVDADNVILRARDIRLTLWTKGSATNTPSASQFRTYAADPTGSLLQWNNAAGFLDLDNPAVVQSFDAGRAPQPGDLLAITGDLGTVTRKVLELVGKDTAASVGGYGHYGVAATGVDAATVVSSSVTIADATLTDTNGSAELFARRYGTFPTTGGLAVRLVITCLTSGNRDTAVFKATANGRTVAIANAAGDDGITDFTVFGDADVSIDLGAGINAWTAGDTFTVDLVFANASSAALISGSVTLTGYNFVTAKTRKASTLFVEVNNVDEEGNVTLRISDSSGHMVPWVEEVDAAGDVDITRDYDGGQITFNASAALTAIAYRGLRLSANITPPGRSSTVFDKLRLDAPIGLADGQPGLRVVAHQVYTGPVSAIEPLTGSENFVVAGEAVTDLAISVSVSGYENDLDSVKPALTGFGQVAPEWRSVTPADSAESLVLITSTQDIVDLVGSTALASELGFGLQAALNAAGKPVWALRTKGASRQDFLDAITTLATRSDLYAIAPLTDDEQILADFAAHAQAMSADDVKKFRKVYGSTDSPGEYPILTTVDNGQAVTATVTAGDGGAFTLVTFNQDAVDLEALSISKGDKLKVTGSGATYLIDRRTGPKTLVLQAGPAAPLTAAGAVEIIAAETDANIARFVWQRSQRLGSGVSQDRRIVNIWTHNGIVDTQDGSFVRIPNRFLAAEVAGYRTALLPQESMTRKPVSVITDAPAMYSMFGRAVLDEMAANGVWIVTQNGPNLTPFHRHQLTTAASDNPLYNEDNAGVIYDFVCFDIDDIYEPLIGNRNVTRQTQVELKNLILAKLVEATQADPTSVVGPMLVDFYGRSGESGTVDVDFDPDFRDSFLIFSELEIPLPLNNVRVRLLARTINVNGTQTSRLVVQPVVA